MWLEEKWRENGINTDGKDDMRTVKRGGEEEIKRRGDREGELRARVGRVLCIWRRSGGRIGEGLEERMGRQELK